MNKVIFGCRPETGATRKSVRQIASMRLRGTTIPSESNLLFLVDKAEVLDQGQTGTCAVQAFSNAARLVEAISLSSSASAISTADVPTPSRRWLYHQARSTHGDQNIDDGTYISSVLKVANLVGWPDEKAAMGWDQNIAESSDDKKRTSWINEAPSADDRRLANDQKGAIEGFFVTGIGLNLDYTLKRVISIGRTPIVFGGTVTWKFLDLDNWKPFSFGSDNAGGHAMILFGFDPVSYYVMNSWGTSWGDKGLCRIAKDDILTRFRDFFAVSKCRKPSE